MAELVLTGDKPELKVPPGLVLTGVYKMKAKHIQGTKLCSLEVPCKYRGKEVIVGVYERVESGSETATKTL